MATQNNTKKIAKNTAVLYVRMILTMIITLYSSRIILRALGFEDFGLYNVVGGVVALLSFLRTSLTSSTQRFLSFELGRNNIEQLKKVFSVSVSTHWIISIIILILAETLGLWFISTQIQIPEGREIAAYWIYQFSVLSLCIGTITVPYNADVISHEKMTFYAVVSIIDAVLKLAFAYALFVFGVDRLILYGGLMLLVNVINFILYWFFCRIKFSESKYHFYFEKDLFARIFSFSSWTIIGQLSVVGANQGTMVLVNVFYSVIANASMGIAQQVNNALTGLTANFQTAFQPQLTKSYAAGDFDYMNQLIYKASKMSFFLLFLVSLPVMMNIDFVLTLWLGKVPEYANEFCIWYIIASLFNAVSAPLWISVFATGKIRNYQIVVSTIFFSDVLIVYWVFTHIYCSPVVAMIVKTLINLIVVIIRLVYAKITLPEFSIFSYLKNVIFPITVIGFITIAMVCLAFEIGMNSWFAFGNTTIIVIISCFMSYRFGLTFSERKKITQILLNKIRKQY